jgi:hypothetical protein
MSSCTRVSLSHGVSMFNVSSRTWLMDVFVISMLLVSCITSLVHNL